MTLIHRLDTLTANSIAAGEVVERPASVVKELVENALDADASVINVEIRQGGISLIRVVDNGGGMDAEDARLAFDRHATSKINRIEDLDAIQTMGFRGEALASIAAVAKVRLETRQLGAPVGTLVDIQGGTLIQTAPTGCAEGTAIHIEQLFFNVPARFKFLKKDSTEAAAVADVLERMALVRPDVSFRLVSQGQELLHTPGNNDLRSAIFAVYGRETAGQCLPVDYQIAPVAVSGFIGRPDAARNSRVQQNLFVNGRLVRSRAISAAIDEAYASHLMKRKFPLAILMIRVPAPLVDVNVHPQKMEVRFWDDQAVFRAVYHAIQTTLQQGGAILPAETAPEGSPSGTDTPVHDVALAGQQPGPATRPGPDPLPGSAALPGLSTLSDQTSLPGRAAQSGPDIAAGSGEAVGLTGSRQPQTLSQTPPQTPDQTPFAAPLYEQPALSGLDLAEPAANLTINSLASARLIGQLFQTYLLLEHGQDLLLVDQHAAHERVLFESLLARHRQAAASPVQPLLVPVTMTVTSRELTLLLSEQDQLHQLGFEFETFGPNTLLIRSLPDSGHYALQPLAAFRVVLDTLLSDRLDQETKISELFYSMACKAAVKAHDVLQPAAMEQLLRDLRQLDDPYHCPHGRPVIIRLSRHELEKKFKRIV